MLLQTNKRKARMKLESQRHRRRSKKETFEVFDISDDGTTLLSSSTGKLSSPASSKGSTDNTIKESQKAQAVNVVEWHIHGDRVSTFNTLATITYSDSELHATNKDSSSAMTLSDQLQTEAIQDSTGQMLDGIVHQYGDPILQDETSEVRSDKENWQSVCPKCPLLHPASSHLFRRKHRFMHG
jgi:hypothetical protein